LPFERCYGGRDSIDHASGAHDDVANAAAGVVAALASSNYEYETMDWVNGPDRRSNTHSLGPSTSEGDNRWTGANSDRPSLYNLSMKHSINLFSTRETIQAMTCTHRGPEVREIVNEKNLLDASPADRGRKCRARLRKGWNHFLPRKV